MTNPPHNLIVFGEDWGGLPSSTQHLIRNMPDRGKVLWFNSIGLRAPTISVSDAKRVMQKLSARRRVSTHNITAFSSAPQPDGMEIAEPNVVPLHHLRFIQKRNAKNLAKQAKAFVESCGVNKPVVWITVPTAAPFLDAMPDLPSIYYCCDDFETLPGVDHATARTMEQKLAHQADLIVVTNEMLAEKFPKEKTIYVPQGVDFELFTAPAPRAPDMPNGKVAGFFGLIAEWVDQDLIVSVARELREEGWTILLIGNANVDISKLEAEPNIVLAGPRPYHDLPSYAQHWDVSLLPFADTPEVRASNPLKLREYLAAGRAVVSTPFPAAAPYADQLMLSDQTQTFIDAVRQATNHEADVTQRRACVALEGWGARANAIMTRLRDTDSGW